MSDHIEVDGKVYYEASYLDLANNNSARRGERISELKRKLSEIQKSLETARSALRYAHERLLTNRFYEAGGVGVIATWNADTDEYLQPTRDALSVIEKALEGT